MEDYKKNYRCTVCDYFYDPEKGDPEEDIEPDTFFKDLPEDWNCPNCLIGKEKLQKK